MKFSNRTSLSVFLGMVPLEQVPHGLLSWDGSLMATVFLVRDRESGDLCALKAIQKQRVKCQESLRNEIAALARVFHKNVTKLSMSYEDSSYL